MSCSVFAGFQVTLLDIGSIEEFKAIRALIIKGFIVYGSDMAAKHGSVRPAHESSIADRAKCFL